MKYEITKRVLEEIAYHEGATLEAYLDKVARSPVWTWGIGVTSASGHNVERYKDNPQTMEKVVEVFKWLLETKYLPRVEKAFKGYDLKEHELAAALSFDWNTGAIHKASWVNLVKEGKMGKARRSFMDWKIPEAIIPRRTKEKDLFFDEHWSNNGTILLYRVAKPSYQPVGPTRVLLKVPEKLSESIAEEKGTDVANKEHWAVRVLKLIIKAFLK